MNIYWFAAFIAWSLFMSGAGWEARDWYDGAAQTKLESHAATDLGNGEAKIISDNQKLTEELSHDSDPCRHDRLPADVE